MDVILTWRQDGSALTKVWKIVTVAFKYNKGNVFKKRFWETAKPSNLREQGVTTFMQKPINTQWTDKDAEDVRRTLEACMVFLYCKQNNRQKSLLRARDRHLRLHFY